MSVKLNEYKHKQQHRKSHTRIFDAHLVPTVSGCFFGSSKALDVVLLFFKSELHPFRN